ncbi:hypothetical protein [Brevibacillus marinus]|uniref:hypothetical protein n=1 Tax=Brevibacillus marinus TaxID=2496837 RepID=UPI000F82D977|nr:hypothetical protein [Brevibacillus marinus]
MITKKGLLILFILANLQLGFPFIFVAVFSVFRGLWALISYFLLVVLVNCGLIRLIKGNWILLSIHAIVLFSFAAYVDSRLQFVGHFIDQFSPYNLSRLK